MDLFENSRIAKSLIKSGRQFYQRLLKTDRFLDAGSHPLVTEIEEKISELTKFGLTPLQAKVYIRLLMLGPSHAKDLGSILGSIEWILTGTCGV